MTPFSMVNVLGQFQVPSEEAVRRLIPRAQAGALSDVQMLTACLNRVIRTLLKPGDTFALNSRSAPAWRAILRVPAELRASVRALKVVTEPSVELNLAIPEQSWWTCLALPLDKAGTWGPAVQVAGELCSDWLSCEQEPQEALLRVVRAARRFVCTPELTKS